MRFLASREAMTTAEQTEAILIFSNPSCHVHSKPSALRPTSARHWLYYQCNPCDLWFNFRTTIVHFLVFLKRLSLKHRASAWCCSRLAKRWQPPSRRRPSWSSAIHHVMPVQNHQHYGRRLRGNLFIPCILWCPKSKKFRVLSCLFVVPVQ